MQDLELLQDGLALMALGMGVVLFSYTFSDQCHFHVEADRAFSTRTSDRRDR